MPRALRRRDLLRSAIAAALAAACDPPSAPSPPSRASLPPLPSPPRVASAAEPAPVTLWSWFDLPDDPRSRELSGLAWEDATRTLFAVQDDAGAIVALHPDAEFRTFALGDVVTVDAPGHPHLDLEALALLPGGDGFLVSSEDGPHVYDLDRRGRVRRELPLPASLAGAKHNKSLESLAISPSGRFLYTMPELPIPGDAPEPFFTRCYRMDRTSGEVATWLYLPDVDTAGAPDVDFGISDMAAIADDDLLVLERGWAHGRGNSARVYRARFGSPKKELFVDVAKLALPADRPPPTVKQPQASPLLDNYEGLALGPLLPNANANANAPRRAVFMVSDDNARADQVARLLVLATSIG